MNYTREDAELDYQMAIEHPVCPVCMDDGFVTEQMFLGSMRVPCVNCNAGKMMP